MLSAILNIVAQILPFILGLFSHEAKTRRENEAFDKALAYGDVADISMLLSARFDRVRSKNTGSDSRQP